MTIERQRYEKAYRHFDSAVKKLMQEERKQPVHKAAEAKARMEAKSAADELEAAFKAYKKAAGLS